MKTEQFKEIVMDTHRITSEMLVSKGEEYATDEDRLYNFRIAAQLKGESMQSSLWGFTVKHLVSIAKMMKDEDKGLTYTDEMWDEKIMDTINYLTMLRAVRRDCLPEPGSVMLKERG